MGEIFTAIPNSVTQLTVTDLRTNADFSKLSKNIQSLEFIRVNCADIITMLQSYPSNLRILSFINAPLPLLSQQELTDLFTKPPKPLRALNFAMSLLDYITQLNKLAAIFSALPEHIGEVGLEDNWLSYNAIPTVPGMMTRDLIHTI